MTAEACSKVLLQVTGRRALKDLRDERNLLHAAYLFSRVHNNGLAMLHCILQSSLLFSDPFKLNDESVQWVHILCNRDIDHFPQSPAVIDGRIKEC